MPSPILPLRSFGPASAPMKPSISAGGPVRAQNFSASKINQKIDREQAAISMSQVLARKAGQENSRSTSVAHIGQTMTAASTSITHAGVARSLNGDDGNSDPGADNRRYAYMRKQIMARQANEAAAAKQAASGSGLNVGTGSGMKKSGTGGLHKTLGKEFREHKSTYGSLSSTEKKVFEQSVGKRLGAKTTGSEINRYDKKAIKSDIKKSGMSISHARILKKVIDKLS